MGAPGDPSANLVPGKNFVTPPGTPAYLTASAVPGAQAQVPVTDPSQPPPDLSKLNLYPGTQPTGSGPKLNAPATNYTPPVASTPATRPLSTVNAPPPPPPGTTQQPAADPLGQVLDHINGPESGSYANPYVTMYGGGQITAQTPSRPGYFGFPVTPPLYGPDGRPTSATGKAQWEADTWRDASTQYMAAGNPAPDFRNPRDQDAVQRFWVTKLYKERTGRDPVADAAAGKFDYSVLQDQWPTLGGNQYPGHESLERIRAGYGAMSEKLNRGVETAIRELNAGSGDLAEAMKRIRAAQDRADQAQDAAMRAIAKAPEKPDMDGVKHISALGTIVGLLGGLFTKAPMLASTNAAAAALEAYNAGDLRSYNIAYKTWENQTNLLFKIADMNASRVRDIMSEEKLPIEERRAKVETLFRALGLSQIADEARIKGDQAYLDWQQKMYQSNLEFKRYMAQLEDTREWRRQSLDTSTPVTGPDGKPALFYPHRPPGQQIQPFPEGVSPANKATDPDQLSPSQLSEVKRLNELDPAWKAAQEAGDKTTMDHIDYDNRQRVIQQRVRTEAAPTRERQITVTDDKGNVIWGGLARPIPGGGWEDTATGDHVPQGRVDEVKGGKAAAPGRQQAAQLDRIKGAANQAVGALTNLVHLPISASVGPFMGVQYQTPDSLKDALARSLAGRASPTLNRQTEIAFKGVSRNLAQLESQGAATGLVGLAKQMETLIPKDSDPPIVKLQIVAEIRQIIDRGVETAKTNAAQTPESMALLDSILEQTHRAVPFTVEDVFALSAAMESKNRPGVDNSLRTIAQKMFVGNPAFTQIKDRFDKTEDAGVQWTTGTPGASTARPAGVPPEAEQAPDGHWYLRPKEPGGKFLRVDP